MNLDIYEKNGWKIYWVPIPIDFCDLAFDEAYEKLLNFQPAAVGLNLIDLDYLSLWISGEDIGEALAVQSRNQNKLLLRKISIKSECGEAGWALVDSKNKIIIASKEV